MRLWLVRHGETEASVAGLYSGHAPAPLTERGIARTQAPGTLLHNVPVDNVLCSELERARHTTQLILDDREAPVRNISKLNEMLSGDWEMRHHRDLAREDAESYAVWHSGWQDATPTNGEDFQAFPRCVERFIARLAGYKMRQNLLVVSHQGMLSVLTTRLLSMPAAAMWHFRVEQGCWSAIGFYGGSVVLKVLNSRAAWHDGGRKPCSSCRRASLPLAPHDELLFSAA